MLLRHIGFRRTVVLGSLLIKASERTGRHSSAENSGAFAKSYSTMTSIKELRNDYAARTTGVFVFSKTEVQP